MTKWNQGARRWRDNYSLKERLCNSMERSSDSALLVDVGGGCCHVTKEVAKFLGTEDRPGRLILQDLHSAVGDETYLRQEGIEAMAYDFFTPQPIRGKLRRLFFQYQRLTRDDHKERKPTIFAPFSTIGPIFRAIRF